MVVVKLNTDKPDGFRIKCPHCTYEYTTRAHGLYVTCSSCQRKIQIQNNRTDKKKRRDTDA